MPASGSSPRRGPYACAGCHRASLCPLHAPPDVDPCWHQWQWCVAVCRDQCQWQRRGGGAQRGWSPSPNVSHYGCMNLPAAVPEAAKPALIHFEITGMLVLQKPTGRTCGGPDFLRKAPRARPAASQERGVQRYTATRPASRRLRCAKSLRREKTAWSSRSSAETFKKGERGKVENQ